MKRLALILAFTIAPLTAAPEDDLVAARRAALELAGAFGNDGFKLRDGHWGGESKAGAANVVQVNLYAGNQYWFSLAATGKGAKAALAVFDEHGKPVACDTHQDGARMAAGFSPVVSGPYYVRVSQADGEAGAFALVYSYK